MPLSAKHKAMITPGASRRNETKMKEQLSTKQGINDLPFVEAMERLV
ncbi:MAG: hypothetical protein WBS20_11110 [Lysobacterales bacterium]